MNTKKHFMLLAAVLLSSASAFAQSGNNEPLKGDVNEDGTVDVADIVDVIKILKDAGGAVGEKMCYWYAGTNGGNAVTADNFTDVASRIPESEIPETGSVTAKGQYIYFVMPETRHLESITDANGSAVEFTFTDVMGYHIYKTNEIVNTTINYTIKQTIYYWYVGQTQPTDTSLATQVNTYTSPVEYTNTGSRGYTYILLHNSKSISSIVGKATGGNVTFIIDNTVNIQNYNVYKTIGAMTSGSTIIITIE